MKKALSISLGSGSRDHTTRHTFLGQEVELERRGTNADFARALALHREYDRKEMEATLLALIDKPQEQITQADLLNLIEGIPLEPNIDVLN